MQSIKTKSFALFVFAGMIACLLLWALLAVFFTPSYLATQLKFTDSGLDFQSLSQPLSQPLSDNNIQKANPLASQPLLDTKSQAAIHLPFDKARQAFFYETLVLRFAKKHPLQTFTLSLWGNEAHSPYSSKTLTKAKDLSPVEIPILYTDGLTARVHLENYAEQLAQLDQLDQLGEIRAMTLAADGIIAPYELAEVIWQPREIRWFDLPALLVSKHSPLKPHQFMISYAGLLGLVFLLILLAAKQLSAKAWWAVLALCWVLWDNWRWITLRDNMLPATTWPVVFEATSEHHGGASEKNGLQTIEPAVEPRGVSANPQGSIPLQQGSQLQPRLQEAADD